MGDGGEALGGGEVEEAADAHGIDLAEEALAVGTDDGVDAEHDHAEGTGGSMGGSGHHSGVIVELGTQSAGGMSVKASYDGEMAPGGDIPIDVWVDGGLGGASSVRFWIGAEDGKGSVKAKAEDEDGHWHTHAEAPSPMPEGSKLWVEI